MDIFEGLNLQQQEAVKATEGRARVIAGAGSGKTKVLTHRFAYLVNEIGINPSNILCVTFTNKAAQEMKKRISTMVSTGKITDFVCTFHGFCLKVLRREIHRIGYPKNFLIIDEEDAKMLAKDVIEERGYTRDQMVVRDMLSKVSKFKTLSGYRYIDDIIINCNLEGVLSDEVRYIQLQQKNYAIDFDDMIYFTLYILDKYADAREYWGNKLNYIMVDETQDCSGREWGFMNILSERHGNLFVVGDPDQAIYEWRGSSMDQFLNFRSDTDIILNENYRSTPNILNVANSVICNNKRRIEKDLFTHIPCGKPAIHFHGETEEDEADWIVNQILSMCKAGAEYRDFAILYRASYLSRSIEQALLDNRVGYVIWGGIRFFERKEIKDALAYLRVIAYKDNISFKRIINTPSRKFGKMSFAKLQLLAEEEDGNLYSTLVRHKDDAHFNKEGVRHFIELIDECDSFKDFSSVSDLLDYILRESGLLELYRSDGDEERLENINELLYSVRQYEVANVEDDISLEAYLQDIALYTNADYKDDGNAVKLMTIHQAKGLEFPYVFVCGLSEGIFPSHRTIRERKENGEEEERRLMYVAATRARECLFLTESEGYISSLQMEKYPSRFILEITDGLLETEGDFNPNLFVNTQMVKDRLSLELDYRSSHASFSVGDHVLHTIFGEGVIKEIAEDGSCIVDFNGKERSMQGAYLKRGME